MTAVCKFRLTGRTEFEKDKGWQLRFEHEHDEDISEDVRFMKSNPWGFIDITIDNEKVLKRFKLGESYTVTFDEFPVKKEKK